MKPRYPAEELNRPWKESAIRVVKMCQPLPKNREGWLLRKQLLRSGTSVAVNYRAACRSRSKAESMAKIGVVVERIGETVVWLELLVKTGVAPRERMAALLAEAHELLAILVASQRTARAPGR